MKYLLCQFFCNCLTLSFKPAFVNPFLVTRFPPACLTKCNRNDYYLQSLRVLKIESSSRFLKCKGYILLNTFKSRDSCLIDLDFFFYFKRQSECFLLLQYHFVCFSPN